MTEKNDVSKDFQWRKVYTTNSWWYNNYCNYLFIAFFSEIIISLFEITYFVNYVSSLYEQIQPCSRSSSQNTIFVKFYIFSKTTERMKMKFGK